MTQPIFWAMLNLVFPQQQLYTRTIMRYILAVAAMGFTCFCCRGESLTQIQQQEQQRQTNAKVQLAIGNAARAADMAQRSYLAVQNLITELQDQKAETERAAIKQEIAQLDARVAAAQEQHNEAQLEYLESLHRQAAASATERPVDSATSQQLYTSLASDSWAKAIAAYPALQNPESMERLALEAFIQKETTNPVHRTEFIDPKWPESMIPAFCAKMNIARSTEDRPAQEPNLPERFDKLILSNGRVLQNVELKSFSSTAVMVRHSEGAESIPFTFFPPQYYEALMAKRPRPTSSTQHTPAANNAAAQRKKMEDSARVNEAAAQSEALRAEALLRSHKAAAKEKAQRYFKYEYMQGPSPLAVEINLSEPEGIPGWPGCYRMTGTAYLDFGRSSLTREFSIETETINNKPTGRQVTPL